MHGKKQQAHSELDYSGLFAPSQSVEEPTEEQSPELLQRYVRGKKAAKKTAEINQAYQANIHAAYQVRTEIREGLTAGEDIHTLFLKACKAISLMTSDEEFYKQATESIVAVYGIGLQEPVPLSLALHETEERLSRLRGARDREREPGARKRLENAIKAHEERAEYLQNQINHKN